MCQHVDSLTTVLCDQQSYTLCPHCSQKLCLDHINDHQLIVKENLAMTVDCTNVVKMKLDDFNEINEMKFNALQNLDTWKKEMAEFITKVHDESVEKITFCYRPIYGP
ncbi:unnamed protein product [Didymodactylos carnosus]|uniref:Uncharacterized protein n=1 Tax=Didymodactylos carnosus TaxID=1234261 RepID=A0A815MT96_9BILA|nr:unnamed protein product [Didymodactylos carnosus]CAF4308521.1 unnamed protein product [Didymodactylos carnosus]